ncbi:MAG: HIRAN domain-containing protein [Prevotella sp.]|nr:HIRAN domain-containing protein [Prevotella sp.]
MREYTVTGIKYCMEGETLEEKKAAARDFVTERLWGYEVMLMAEPDNPFDPDAIAVYIDYRHIGYIMRDETDEVHQLLDENGMCMARTKWYDGESTLFIEIPSADAKKLAKPVRKRQLPESPLGEMVCMPFTKEEHKLQMLGTLLEQLEMREEMKQRFVELVKQYVPLMMTSICREDTLLMRKVYDKLLWTLQNCDKEAWAGDALSELAHEYTTVRRNLANLHRGSEQWPAKIFAEHLDRLRGDKEVNQHLFNKYSNTFLDGTSIEDADLLRVEKEYDRLMAWLKAMKWSELRNPQDLTTMGKKVAYLRISRKELYDLYSVMLITERLRERLGSLAGRRAKVIEALTQTSIFYSTDDKEMKIEKFYDDIVGKKPTEITSLVNDLVAQNVISNMSCNRDLWSILNVYGLYEKGENNWNSQIKRF